MNQIRAWIFDLDDTLFPEVDFVFSGYEAVDQVVVRTYGVSIKEKLKERFKKGERGDLFTPALIDLGLNVSEELVKGLVAVYRSHHPKISPFKDVLPFLEKLRSQSKKIALVTDGWHQVQSNKVESLGLRNFFDSIVYTDAIWGRESWKPNPIGFEVVLKELGVAAHEAVYIGDNPAKDFDGPALLGMKSIRIRRSGGEHEHRVGTKAAATVSLEIQTLNELSDDLI